MKNQITLAAIAAFATVAAFAALGWADYEHKARLSAEFALADTNKNYKADVDDLTSELNEKSADAAVKSATASEANKAVAGKAAELANRNKQYDDLNQKLVQADKDLAAAKRLAEDKDQLLTVANAKLEAASKAADAAIAAAQAKQVAKAVDPPAVAKADPEPRPVSHGGELVPWFEEYEPAAAKAEELNRPLLIDFCLPNNPDGSPRCPQCERVKHRVYENAAISPRLRREFVAVCLWPEDTGPKYGVRAYPMCVIVKRDGEVCKFEPSDNPEEFTKQLDEAMSDEKPEKTPQGKTQKAEESPLVWESYNPPGCKNNCNIYDDVLSRGNAGWYPDAATRCHESSHILDGKLCHGDDRGFYVGGGKMIHLKQPRTTLSAVAKRVTKYRRSSSDEEMNYKLYLIQAQQWHQQNPLEVLEEFHAYVLDMQCQREMRLPWQGTEDRLKWFTHWSDCLLQAVREDDPGYADMERLVQFTEYLQDRAAKLIEQT